MLFTHRAKLGWNLGLDIDSDPRGSTDHNLSPSPDIWHASTISSLFTYGSDGAIGRIETEAMLEHKRYVNNPETTAGYNLDESDLATRFIYRVAPATSLLIEVRQINSDYQLSTSPNTNTDRRLLLGIIWHANTFTSASFKIGAVRKNFIDSDYSNYSGLNWDGKFNWSPLRTSALELSTTQVCSDSSGEGQYIVNRTFEADWTHSWSAFAQSHLNLIQTTSDYYGAVRQDRTTSYSVEADYLLRRWLKLGVGFTQTRRSSTQADIPFIRNILFLNVMGSL